MRKTSPAFFEKLVVDLLVAMGYGGSVADAGKAVGRSGDGSIDSTIKEDKLGLDVVYVHGKQVAELMIEHNVGVAPSQAFTLKRVDSDYFESI